MPNALVSLLPLYLDEMANMELNTTDFRQEMQKLQCLALNIETNPSSSVPNSPYGLKFKEIRPKYGQNMSEMKHFQKNILALSSNIIVRRIPLFLYLLVHQDKRQTQFVDLLNKILAFHC